MYHCMFAGQTTTADLLPAQEDHLTRTVPLRWHMRHVAPCKQTLRFTAM